MASSSRSAGRPASRTPLVVYLYALIEILITFGDAIISVPAIRLVESAVCQNFYHVPALQLSEPQCKGDEVQRSVAYLLGVLSSVSAVPTLLLTLPYGILAELIDRRVILLANCISLAATALFKIAICRSEFDLRFIWLSGLFSIVGGGGAIAITILRTTIAESLSSASLSTTFYRLSAIRMVVNLVGTALGSWLLQNLTDGAASAMLVGITMYGLIIPIFIFLPKKRHHFPEAKEESTPLTRVSESLGEDAEPEELEEEESHVSLPNSRLNELRKSLRAYAHLFRHSRPFVLCLVIFSAVTLATTSHSLLTPWMAKRYSWPLSTAGYISSLESLFSGGLLFLLQHLESRSSSLPFHLKRRRELTTAKWSLGVNVLGSLIVALSTSRAGFIAGTLTWRGSVGFGDALKAYFTAIITTVPRGEEEHHGENVEKKEDIGRLYSGILITENVCVICSSPVWAVIFSWGYDLGGVGMGLPFLVSAGMLAGTLVFIWWVDRRGI